MCQCFLCPLLQGLCVCVRVRAGPAVCCCIIAAVAIWLAETAPLAFTTRSRASTRGWAGLGCLRGVTSAVEDSVTQ